MKMCDPVFGHVLAFLLTAICGACSTTHESPRLRLHDGGTQDGQGDRGSDANVLDDDQRDAGSVEQDASADAELPNATTCDDCGDGVCDVGSGACVQCLRNADCGARRPFCVENTCERCAANDNDCTDSGGGGDDPDDPPSTVGIRFASYNVRTSNLNNSAWRDTHVGWDANDQARMERVADIIASHDLTVVAAQEMRRAERDAVLGRLQKKHNQNWGHSAIKQGADDTAVLFLRTTWSKVRDTYFKIPLQPGLRDRYQVGTLLKHNKSGRRVWFYSVHYAAGGSAGAPMRAEGARKTVMAIRSQAVDANLPFVLGGDMNTTSHGPVGNIFDKAGFLKYTRRVADRKTNNGCKSFNTRAGWEGKQTCPGGAASHIDQVWVSRPKMDVLKYEIVATSRSSRASDHNPLVTILRQQ